MIITQIEKAINKSKEWQNTRNKQIYEKRKNISTTENNKSNMGKLNYT